MTYLSLGEQLGGVVLGHHGLGNFIHDAGEYPLVVVCNGQKVSNGRRVPNKKKRYREIKL